MAGRLGTAGRRDGGPAGGVAGATVEAAVRPPPGGPAGPVPGLRVRTAGDAGAVPRVWPPTGKGGGVRRTAFTIAAAAAAVVCVARWPRGCGADSSPSGIPTGGGGFCFRGTLYFKTLSYIGELPNHGPRVTLIYDDWWLQWHWLGFEFGRGENIHGRIRYATTGGRAAVMVHRADVCRCPGRLPPERLAAASGQTSSRPTSLRGLRVRPPRRAGPAPGMRRRSGPTRPACRLLKPATRWGLPQLTAGGPGQRPGTPAPRSLQPYRPPPPPTTAGRSFAP